MSDALDVQFLSSQSQTITQGATRALYVGPEACQAAWIRVSRQSGGSLLIVGTTFGQTLTGAQLVAGLTFGYIVGTTEWVTIPGRAAFYLMSIGSDTVVNILKGKHGGTPVTG